MLRLTLALLLLVGAASAYEMSDCLKKCIEPVVRIERSISYLYRHYNDICETLETAAFCSQTCSNEDQSRFFTYTTFYRVHCVELEEELEEHIPCLREASYKADFICRDQCLRKDEKAVDKTEKQRKLCKTIECSTLCFYKHLTSSCPSAQPALTRANIRNADEMRRLTPESQIEEMSEQCKRVHDGAYMRRQMAKALAE